MLYPAKLQCQASLQDSRVVWQWLLALPVGWQRQPKFCSDLYHSAIVLTDPDKCALLYCAKVFPPSRRRAPGGCKSCLYMPGRI